MLQKGDKGPQKTRGLVTTCRGWLSGLYSVNTIHPFYQLRKLQDGQEGGSNQGGAIAGEEKPEAKATWQGAVDWVKKYGMAFDTLKVLQLSGWLLFSNAITACFLIFLTFQSERVFIPALSLLASLLYAALALVFYFELL